MILLTIHADPSVIGRGLQFITQGAELLRFMRSRLHFEDLFELAESVAVTSRFRANRSESTQQLDHPLEIIGHD